MKYTFTTLALLLGIFAFSQERIIPPDYEKTYDERKDFIEQNQSPDKIFLDPMEQTPIAPSEYSLQGNGNWAYTHYGIPEHTQWIRDNTKRKVAVFIFDTAGKLEHPALRQFVQHTHNRTFTGEDPADGNGHGTHVASCYAGIHPSGFFMGPASVLGPENLMLISYKVLRNQGFGYTNEIGQGIELGTTAAEQLMAEGWFVIFNFSLGAQSVNSTFDRLLSKAEEKGIYVVAAAGNDGREFISTPANGKSAHSIAALDNNNSRANFSNFGPENYMAAPGVRIYGAWGSGYAELSGTSMAAPSHGAMVAIQAATSDATAKQISNFHRAKATNLGSAGWDKFYGFGYTPMENLTDDDPSRYSDEHNGNPGNDPDDPTEPDDPGDNDPPTKDKYAFSADFSQPFTVIWKAQGQTKFTTTKIYVTVEMETDLHAEYATKELAEITADFFERRVFVLRANDDYLDAGHWANHFFDMIVGREHEIEMTDYQVEYLDGLRAKRNGKQPVRTFLNRVFSPVQCIEIEESEMSQIKQIRA